MTADQVLREFLVQLPMATSYMASSHVLNAMLEAFALFTETSKTMYSALFSSLHLLSENMELPRLLVDISVHATRWAGVMSILTRAWRRQTRKSLKGRTRRIT